MPVVPYRLVPPPLGRGKQARDGRLHKPPPVVRPVPLVIGPLTGRAQACVVPLCRRVAPVPFVAGIVVPILFPPAVGVVRHKFPSALALIAGKKSAGPPNQTRNKRRRKKSKSTVLA